MGRIKKVKMNDDWGLWVIVFIMCCGAVQFVTRFIVDPFLKKRKGLPYKFSKAGIVFAIITGLFAIVYFVLTVTGAFKYE